MIVTANGSRGSAENGHYVKLNDFILAITMDDFLPATVTVTPNGQRTRLITMRCLRMRTSSVGHITRDWLNAPSWVEFADYGRALDVPATSQNSKTLLSLLSRVASMAPLCTALRSTPSVDPRASRWASRTCYNYGFEYETQTTL
jgi:hypothetical protein